MSRFDEYFESWVDLLLPGQLDDCLTGRSKKDQDYFVARTRKEIATLRAAVGHSLPVWDKDGADEVKPFAPSFGILAQLERSL